MEEENPWLDPESGKHKNKKSIKPKLVFEPRTSEIRVPETQNETQVPVKQENRLIPGFKKCQDEKVLDFLNTLIEDSLDSNLPESVEKWAIENFDKAWLEDFLSDVKLLKEELLTSAYFPSQEKMVLLKFLFLMRQGI